MLFERKRVTRYSLFGVLFAVAVSLTAFGPAVASESSHPHWAYEGEHGPAHWGDMSKEFEACSKGKNQSPVDIAGAEEADLKDIEFSYKPSKLNVLNNGHTVQVNYDKGSSIKVDGVEYQLVQFHFHDPSEHTIGGKSFPTELHLVHKNGKGELAVVGVVIEKGAQNPAYKEIWANLPKKADEKKEVNVAINADDLLPKTRTYYTYTGSLTTPPCTENVKWLVLKTPIQMSETQIDQFNGVIKGNNRPVQPINTRKIKAEKGR